MVCLTTLEKALHSWALVYLEHISDLRERMVFPLCSRIKQVVRFEHGLDDCHPRAYLAQDNLLEMLRQQTLLIPFAAIDDISLPHIIREVLSHLLTVLVEAYDGSKGVARYDATWKAYQAELALEEIICGRPISESDYQLSVSLGTSTVGQFSLSNERGFIGLAPHNTARDGEVPPPLCNWTKSGLQMDQINRRQAWQGCKGVFHSRYDRARPPLLPCYEVPRHPWIKAPVVEFPGLCPNPLVAGLTLEVCSDCERRVLFYCIF